nr:hypothetical protein CFP56_51476 [Quercus suber]
MSSNHSEGHEVDHRHQQHHHASVFPIPTARLTPLLSPSTDSRRLQGQSCLSPYFGFSISGNPEKSLERS